MSNAPPPVTAKRGGVLLAALAVVLAAMGAVTLLPKRAPMTEDQFWNLVEGLPLDKPGDVLRARLEPLPAELLVEFQGHFVRYYWEAYDWKLWGAAFLSEGGAGDDGFAYFRYGLISRGRKIFEAAVADPDSLVELQPGAKHLDISDEDFGSVAWQLYSDKVGREMPEMEAEIPAEPTGEKWDFEDKATSAQKLPKLWARFGGK